MDKYGLIGCPLGHSFSQNFFTDKFRCEGIDATYENFEIPEIHDVLEILAANPNLRGFNVTIPYKEKIIPFLDEISKAAHQIGAVNVVKVVRKGGRPRLYGYNTDVTGFADSIQTLLRPYHKKALILGTGGASKSVHYALTQMLGLEAVFVSRFQRPDTVTYEQIDATAVHEYNVIVNCTPVGMFPKVDACPNLPYEALTSENLLFDLVYNPETTLFMRRGAQAGATVRNGLEMLVLQALASWDIWTGNDNGMH